MPIDQFRSHLVICSLCASALEELRDAVAPLAKIAHSETYQDLIQLLERALNLASAPSRQCQLCSLAPRVIYIADRINPKHDRTLEERALLTSVLQLKTIRGEFTENVLWDCRTLRDLLQFIMDTHGNRTDFPFSSSAGVLDRAHDLRINGANFTSVAGNSIQDSSSTFFVFVKQESGIGFLGIFVLLLLGFLFCLS